MRRLRKEFKKKICQSEIISKEGEGNGRLGKDQTSTRRAQTVAQTSILCVNPGINRKRKNEGPLPPTREKKRGREEDDF